MKYVEQVICRDKKRTGGCQGLGKAEWGGTNNGVGVSFWDDGNVLEQDGSGGGTTFGMD